MYKNFLIIGTTLIVIFLSLTQITVGYNINYYADELNNENINSNKHIYQVFHDFYSTDDISDFFKCQNDYVLINQKSREFKLDDPIEPDQHLDGPMDSPWPMYCHDVRHTGRSPYNTTSNPGFEKWWYKTIKGFVEGSAAIDKDGVIYFGSWHNVKDNFYALYPNGTLKWKYNIGGSVMDTGPAIDENGIIYVGTSSTGGDHLFAFYPNGTVKWTYFTGNWIYGSPVIGNDGTIYFGTAYGYPWYGYIYALCPNGTLKWRYKTNDVIRSDPAIGPDGTVYCGSHDNYLYALYSNNGTLKWKYKTGHWIRTSPCIGDDGTIYCVSLDNYLHAVYPNGTRKWITNVGAGTSPTIGQDGTIYAGYNILHAVNPDGSVKWTFNVGGTMRGGTPCNSADGTIYVGTSDGGKIIAINPDGTEKWRKHIGKCEFAPVIGEDGTIYIGTSLQEETRPGAFDTVGYLYAFNELDPDAPSAPKITGPTSGNSKIEIDYTFKSTSPLGNDVYYYIDWGDGDWRIDWWLGPYGSGKNAVISHIWSNPGKYTIKSRCKDTDNLWSDWSEFKVTIPRNRASIGSNCLRFLEHFPNIFSIFRHLSV